MTTNSRWMGLVITMGAVAGVLGPESDAHSGMSARGYASSKFALELNGAPAGYIKSAAGGEPVADVVLERLGPDHIVKKHLGSIRYEPVTVTAGLNMSAAFHNLIQGTLEHKPQRVTGALLELDFDYKEEGRLQFANALVSQIDFPALDAASSEAVFINMSFAPESTRYARGSMQPYAAAKTSAANAKRWTKNSFRLKIDGIDCTHVSKIEAFTVQQKSSESSIGELRDYERVPTSLELSNLVVTVDDAHAQDFVTWRNDFVVGGKNDDAKEKNGTLEYLSTDLRTVYFTLTFKHLGIFRMGGEPVTSGNETVRKSKVQMYVEDVSYSYDRGIAP
jgi:hypothetical protein